MFYRFLNHDKVWCAEMRGSQHSSAQWIPSLLDGLGPVYETERTIRKYSNFRVFTCVLSYRRGLGTAILFEGKSRAFGLKASLHVHVLHWGYFGFQPNALATQVTVRHTGGNGACRHSVLSHQSRFSLVLVTETTQSLGCS